MAPAPASRLELWGGLHVVFENYAHRHVLTVMGFQVLFQHIKLVILKGVPVLVTISVPHKSIIAVERGEHSVQQRPCRSTLWIERKAIGEPNPPTVIKMRYARSGCACAQELIEIPQAAEGYSRARAFVTLMGIENIADISDARSERCNRVLAGFRRKLRCAARNVSIRVLCVIRFSVLLASNTISS
jgi:hypothetical protein